MATLNISLPGPMEAFVRAQCERDYGNVSEYFRTLVREKMKHEIEADLRFLKSTQVRCAAGSLRSRMSRKSWRCRNGSERTSPVRVVLDANVVASGVCWDGEAYLCLVKLARRHAFAFGIISEARLRPNPSPHPTPAGCPRSGPGESDRDH